MRLPIVERCRREQICGADDTIHRRPYLVAHRRQELRLGAVGGLGLLAGLDQFLLGTLAFGDLGGEALRQFDLPPGKGRDERDRHDQDDEDRDQRRQEHRRGRHVGERRAGQRKEDRRLHRRVMHAGNGEAHERRGQRRRGKARGNRAVEAEADAERDEGQAYRDHDRHGDQPGIVAQQCLGLHCRHSGIVHQADAGAHQHAADRQPLEPGIGARADRVQRDAAGQHAGDHRQHSPDRRVGHAAGQREGEHANEMHAPDAAAHRHRAGARPCPLGAARIGRHDAPGDRQGNERRQRGDDDGEHDQPGVVGAAKGRRRIDLVENREKPPIEIEHAKLAMSTPPQSSQLIGKYLLNERNIGG